MKNEWDGIGVMSGTSLDGIDLAWCHFSRKEDGKWDYRIEKAVTVPYPDDFRQRLSNAQELSAFEYVKLNNDICLEADVIFIETTEEKYREWYKEFCRHRYINRGKADRTILSLDAPLGEEETGSLYDVIAYEDTSVEEAVISPELLRFLYVAVSSLSKRAREAIEAKYFTYAGWPDSAIAEAMGIDVDVFQKRKRRAIENLKNFFK